MEQQNIEIGNKEMRKGKTRQDRMPMGERDRVKNWDKVRSWSMEHKPRNSSDWIRLDVEGKKAELYLH